MNRFIEVNGKLINKDYIIEIEDYAGLCEVDDKESTICFDVYIYYMLGDKVKTEIIEVMKIIFPNAISEILVKDKEFIEMKNMCLKKLKEQFHIVKKVLGTDKIPIPTQEK